MSQAESFDVPAKVREAPEYRKSIGAVRNRLRRRPVLVGGKARAEQVLTCESGCALGRRWRVAAGQIFNQQRNGIAMNLRHLLTVLALMSAPIVTQAADGLIAVKSPYSAKETMNRLEEVVKQKGLNVFARIDHAAGAAKIGKTLRPTELLIFGNPQGGTPLMECAQTMGIDLPLKALVWEDASAQVWLGYNDITFIAKRHEVPDCAAPANLSKALAGMAGAAVAP